MNNKGNLTDKRPPFLPMLIGTGFYSGLWPYDPRHVGDGSPAALLGRGSLTSGCRRDGGCMDPAPCRAAEGMGLGVGSPCALPLLRYRQAFGHQEARPQDGGFLGYGR